MQFKRFCSLGIAAAVSLSVLAGSAVANTSPTQLEFDFNQSDSGFTPIFSDYPNETGVEAFYEFQSSHTDVPIVDAGKGLYISGNNHSDDLFMGYYKKLTGLAPKTDYQFTIQFQLGTNVETDLIGIGGTPGESVFVKCGVASTEPKNHLDTLNHFRLNLDKSSQSQGGADLAMVGHLAKDVTNRPGEYEFKTVQTKVVATTDAAGSAYLVIGTDSGFEGITSYYLDDISVSWSLTEDVLVTRGDAAVMLLDHINPLNKEIGTSTFSDVPWDAPYARAIAWTQQKGYLCGYSDNTFRPDQPMTTEQAMVMLHRLFGSPDMADTGILEQYPDGKQVSPWAQEAVSWALTHGFLAVKEK